MLTIPLRKGSLYEQKTKYKNHDEYLSRIEKSLYYVNLPKAYCTSLPCTELAAEIFSEINKFSLDQLDIEEAAKLSHNACVSPCSLVLALLYLDRLKSSNPKYLTKVSPSELFLISLMVGSKFLQDDGEEDEVNNYEWAASAGINVQDINIAEKLFLDAIKWEVFVSEKEFWDGFRAMECKLGLRQGSKRGWFTYTELHLLLEFIDIASIVQTLCTVTTACLTSYAASMLTMLGSALLVVQILGFGLRVPITAPSAAGDVINGDCSTNISGCDLRSEMMMEKSVQDCPVHPSSLECDTFAMLAKLSSSPSPSPLSSPSLSSLKGCCNAIDSRISDCSGDDRLHFLLKFPPLSRSHNDSFASSDEYAKRGRMKLFETCGNHLWGWTDVIRNYLLINSVPVSFFPFRDVLK